MNLKYIFAICFLFSQSVMAQTTASRTDTLRLSVYNTGGVYELKRAPFGEQLPQVGVIKAMVFAEDSFDVKKKEVTKTFKPEDNQQLRVRVIEFKPSELNHRPTDAEIEKEKLEREKVKNSNEGKRTCQIAVLGLKDKIVLVDFDKNCDPTFKCLQAQQGGASAVIVIYDTNKKDSIAMARGRYDSQIKIPCFSITRAQGDSLRGMLPSRVALYVPQPIVKNALLASTLLNMEAQAEYDKSHITWNNKTSEQNDYFIVEKQNPITGVFETLVTANTRSGIGLEKYNTYDENPIEGDNTYRIKLVLLNGEVQYSEQKIVKFSANSNVKIFPNPTEDVLNLALKGYDTQPLEIAIFDVQGKVIHSQHLDRVSNAALSIPLGDKAVSGQYMLLLKSKGKKDVMRQFTVTR
jgi:hypothetical protein